jgi:ArsR family transcriptional regulator
VVKNGSLVPDSVVAGSSCCASSSGDAVSEADAQELASIFAALADPVRLRLLSLVAAGQEVCSCHLEGPLAKSQPTISHHTSVLQSAGLLVGEKRGRWVYWRIVPERLQLVSAFISAGR